MCTKTINMITDMGIALVEKQRDKLIQIEETTEYKLGYQAGLSKGKEESFQDVHDTGYGIGYDTGYSDGYYSGHTDGFNDCIDGYEEDHASGEQING